MTKEEILDYATQSPQNTNRAVLNGMLGALIETESGGGSGGGGGSSDFTTAEVTITNTTNDGYILFPCIGAEYGGVMEDWNTMEVEMVNPDPDGYKYKIPIYKDGTILMVEGNPPYTIAVTGSITVDNGTITVTGNGTITMS